MTWDTKQSAHTPVAFRAQARIWTWATTWSSAVNTLKCERPIFAVLIWDFLIHHALSFNIDSHRLPCKINALNVFNTQLRISICFCDLKLWTYKKVRHQAFPSKTPQVSQTLLVQVC